MLPRKLLTLASFLAKPARSHSRRVALLLVAVASGCFGAQLPDRVDGWLYQETGSGFQNIKTNFGVRLNSDGTVTGVYGNGGLSGFLFTTTPPSGAWRYTKNADGTAAMVINTGSTAGSPNPDFGTRNLVVGGEDNGTVFGGVTNLVGPTYPNSFRLSPPGALPAFSNSATRCFVRPGGIVTVGFIIQNVRRTVLTRAVGPGLQAFGVSGTLADPEMSVFRAPNGFLFATNNDWDQQAGSTAGDSISRTGQLVGAFPLASGAKDAALVLTLDPGSYTVQVSGVRADDSGEVLIETYVLP